LACSQQDAHRLSPATAPRSREVLARQRFVRGADGVQIVRLGAIPASGSGRAIDPDDTFVLLEQERGEPPTKATGAFDRPHPPRRRMCASKWSESSVSKASAGNVCVTWTAPVISMTAGV